LHTSKIASAHPGTGAEEPSAVQARSAQGKALPVKQSCSSQQPPPPYRPTLGITASALQLQLCRVLLATGRELNAAQNSMPRHGVEQACEANGWLLGGVALELLQALKQQTRAVCVSERHYAEAAGPQGNRRGKRTHPRCPAGP
jgi:hypothetical protein